MHILSTHPELCSQLLEARVAEASSLEDAFELVRPLAYHDNCSVSLQTCRATGQQVAVKSYPKFRLSSLGREQVDTEAQIHSTMLHEHVVPLLISMEDDRCIHLVLEWADGGDLKENLKGMGEAQLKTFLVQPLLEALALCEQQGVVHRDLKPDNVLVHDGKIMLADFGLAVYCNSGLLPQEEQAQEVEMQEAVTGAAQSRLQARRSSDGYVVDHSPLPSISSLADSCVMGSSLSLDELSEVQSICSSSSCADTAAGQPQGRSRSKPSVMLRRPASSPELMSDASGTPLYTAPEVLLAMFQSRPIHEVVSPKNDVWGLGVMVLEALTGCHPFSPGSCCHRGSCDNLLYSVAHHTSFRLPSHLSPEAQHFLLQVTHKDPAQRPSATQLLNHPWLKASTPAPVAAQSPAKCSQKELPKVRVVADVADFGLAQMLAGSSPLLLSPSSCKVQHSSGGGAFALSYNRTAWEADCWEY